MPLEITNLEYEEEDLDDCVMTLEEVNYVAKVCSKDKKLAKILRRLLDRTEVILPF